MMTDEEEYEQSVKENADDPLALFCLAMFKEPMTAERLEGAAKSLSGSADADIEKARREGYMLAVQNFRDYGDSHLDERELANLVESKAPGKAE